MKIAIAGGGKVGRFIARDLLAQGHDVLIIDVDRTLVERHHDAVPARWVCADACELSALEAADLEGADVVICATGDDKANLVVSLLAKQEFAVPRVIARVNHPKNQWLFTESWGVDRCVSGAHLLVAMVEEAVVAGTLVELLQLEGGQATLAEITLAPWSVGVGRTITEVSLPPGAAVVAVIRDGTVIVPRPDSLLLEGDEVMVLVGAGAGEAVVAALVGDGDAQSSS